MVIEPFWGLGAAAVGLAAWLFPQWRHYHLATSIPVFAVICLSCAFPPDSLPWLMMNGKQEQVRRFVLLRDKLNIVDFNNDDKCSVQVV